MEIALKGKEENLGGISSDKEIRVKILRLNLTSDVFIGKVLERPEVLEELLFLLLRERFHIKTVQGQYSIRQLLRHSVILDVYAEEEKGKIIHLELQNKDDDDHVKRMLYCRSSIVVTLLDSGVRYEELPELYQIFISRNDFLHTGKAVVYNRKPYPDGVTEVYSREGKVRVAQMYLHHPSAPAGSNTPQYSAGCLTLICSQPETQIQR